MFHHATICSDLHRRDVFCEVLEHNAKQFKAPTALSARDEHMLMQVRDLARVVFPSPPLPSYRDGDGSPGDERSQNDDSMAVEM